MANVKRKIGSIRDLDKKGKPLYVVLRRSAGFDAAGKPLFDDVLLPLDHSMSTAERERINALYPDPLPPLKMNQVTGIEYRNASDEDYWRQANETLPAKRLYARVVVMLGAAQFGVAEVQTLEGIEAAVAVLRGIEGITPADCESIDYQGRNPNEVTEEGIQAKEHSGTPSTPAPPAA
jgi:hypothetical protein